MLRFFEQHVEEHYRHADGTPTSEVENFAYSLRPLKELYGHTMAAEFGPRALKAVVLVNPMSYVVDAVRGLCLGMHRFPIVLDVAVVLAAALVFGALARQVWL